MYLKNLLFQPLARVAFVKLDDVSQGGTHRTAFFVGFQES